jgi:hypothetical protein
MSLLSFPNYPVYFSILGVSYGKTKNNKRIYTTESTIGKPSMNLHHYATFQSSRIFKLPGRISGMIRPSMKEIMIPTVRKS